MTSAISSDGLDPRRRRLLFRCRHRGIREMDLVLGAFADASLATLTEEQLQELERWLEIPDQLIFSWISGAEPTPAEFDTLLFRGLSRFHRGGPE
ncbi:MAG TPA: succinate dehydrogenase assembly factor 2 [Pseudolabrys sp.]|nr:succinate dehydrogenase assembly factor 2 [Pseudolabrys sp.]